MSAVGVQSPGHRDHFLSSLSLLQLDIIVRGSAYNIPSSLPLIILPFFFLHSAYIFLSTLHYFPSSSLSLTRLVLELISSGARVLLPGPIWLDRLSVYCPLDLQIQKGPESLVFVTFFGKN